MKALVVYLAIVLAILSTTFYMYGKSDGYKEARAEMKNSDQYIEGYTDGWIHRDQMEVLCVCRN